MRFLAFILLLLPGLSMAQGAATLVADQVLIEGDTRLIATGNIEVFYDDTRLSAAEVIYDRSNDRLQIIGPIFIAGPNGAVLTADRASLDPTLENGILRGARLVLDQQLQLAANRIDRRNGRYNQLYKAAVTSCHVCGDHDPLWDIRAERVVHDEAERQLYFTNATFRVVGVPILWLPRLRLPDPTLDRATGFLIPRIRTTNRLGTGIKTPYFIALGDHRDLTLTPYLSPQTRTLEARYRQAFYNGQIEANVAFSDDTLVGANRSYIFAEGSFDLARDFQLNFDIEAASDPAYLLDYGYSDADRLDTAISIQRVRTDELFFASATYFESLRDDEVNAQLPPIVADFRYEKRMTDVSGGALTLVTSGDLLYRYGNGTGDEGRDMLRVGVGADWQRTWSANNGVILDSRLGIDADLYRVRDDPNLTAPFSRTTPHVQATLRYPLQKTSKQARHLLEPVLSVAWSDVLGDAPPNEDSTRPELDQGSLFALSRFPGEDAVEKGARIAAGLSWTRLGLQGSSTRLTFGRVFRDENNAAFTVSSGLNSATSDWLIAGQHSTGQGLQVEGRALLDDRVNFTIASAKVGWITDDIQVDASYIWEAPDRDLGRFDAAAAWAFSGRVQLEDAWAVEFDTRYDVDADTPTRAGLGIEWRNECVTVDLSVSRRYTTSTTVAPSTDYGLSIELTGFSAGRSTQGPKTRCDDTTKAGLNR